MRCDPRRTQILEAALRRFDHYGYRKTTMADIAREAGVSVGALYLFFKSKEEILLANAEQRYHQYVGEMRAVLSKSESPLVKLEEANRVRVLNLNRLWTASPHGGELVQLLQERFRDRHRCLLQEEIRILEAILKEGIEAGVLRTDDIPSTALCVHAAFAAFLPPHSDGYTEQQLRWGVAHMTRLLVEGLRSR